MNEQETNELLTHVLDGHASDEEKHRLLEILGGNEEIRAEVAEQLAIDGLLGISLEKESGKDFQLKLRERLAAEEERNFVRGMMGSLGKNLRGLALYIGPVLAILAWLASDSLLSGHGSPITNPHHASWAIAILTLCVFWWIFEPLPIGIISLIPLAVFPVVGILDERQIASAYCHPLLILFLSGFILAKAMEHCGVHRRLAFGLVRVIGGSSGKRIVLGFMVASAGISIWISNTVTVLMLLPAALAVIDKARSRKLSTPLLLGIAYAAAIGGMGSPVGTPPNGIMIAQTDLLAAAGALAKPFGFFDWMKVGIPLTCILIPVAWLWLTRSMGQDLPIRISPGGRWSKAEVRVSLVLGLTALLWMTRDDPFGGWSNALGLHGAKNGSVGLLAVIALFLIPSGDSRKGKLLEWEHVTAVPWAILFLLGAGIAIGSAFSATGIDHGITSNFTRLAGLPLLPMLAAVVFGVSILTEMCSNTATSTVLMPLLAATAVAADMPPAMLMLAASMANSCSFMLPISTPPNAIVFAVGDFSIRRMFWEGLVLKMISAVVITAVCYLMMA